MEDVEGVTAEEATVEPVENQAEPVEAEVSDEGEQEDAENASELSDEELERVLNDPRAKARLEKQIAEEVDRKTARQKAANRQLQKKVEELQKLREQEPLVKPKMEDFDTDEAYDKAIEEYDEKRVERLAEEKALEKQAETAAQEQYDQAREAFTEKQEAFRAETPDYDDNVKVVQDYIDIVQKEFPNDPGFQEFSKYIALECDNAPALLNHLGAHPEKIEDLLGKPPSIIRRKLEGYAKDLTKKTEIPETLPPPLKKTKGAATPQVSAEKLSDPNAYMKWRQNQLKRK